MPDGLAIAQVSDRLAVFHHIGDNIELGIFLVEWFPVRIRPGWIKFAEAFR